MQTHLIFTQDVENIIIKYNQMIFDIYIMEKF